MEGEEGEQQQQQQQHQVEKPLGEDEMTKIKGDSINAHEIKDAVPPKEEEEED